MDSGPLPTSLRVNGAAHALVVEPRRTLLDVLREDLLLTGAKKVCDMGNCGACTVLVDGSAVYACLLLAVDCQGSDIVTVEGVEQAGLDSIQRAVLAADALQCGFCTPGQVMSLEGLFALDPHPSDAEIERALSGNLCRCGAYRNLLRAGRIAAGRAADPAASAQADGPA